jgi:hypothetical protein
VGRVQVVSGAVQRPPLTAAINVPVTMQIVAVNHERQSVTISIRAGRYSTLHTYTVTESA